MKEKNSNILNKKTIFGIYSTITLQSFEFMTNHGFLR